MKYIKISLIVFLILLQQSFTHAICYKCKLGKTYCSGAGYGQCWWEGGAVCIGYGDCSPVFPLQEKTECIEDKNGSMASCNVVKTKAVMTSGCKINCYSIPFVSCRCLTTGETGAGNPKGPSNYTHCE